MTDETYFDSPLASRYASKEMLAIFMPNYRYAIWRKLWIALARAQKNLGVPIQTSQILAMEKKIHEIDLKRVAYYEKQLGHDVMAHIYAFGDVCPESRGIIHLGASSCYITDNADLLLMKEGLVLLKNKLVDIIRKFGIQAEQYADLPCLGYAHFQTTQPTTVGKRICMWIQDLLMDFYDLVDKLEQLHFLGAKGVSGTQVSYLQLFDNDPSKIKQMEKMIADEMGFSKVLSISGQTYTRKQDVRVANVLASIAISAHKFGTDLRLLAHMREMEEGFGEKQNPASATPYKRNPNRSERMCGLARFLMSLQENPKYTAATQWLERSLDDSSNRRLSIPEIFLTADSILNLFHFLSSNLIVYPKIIEKHLTEELPFLATESIVLASTKKGCDKLAIQEALKKHISDLSKKWKEEGIKEDLIERITKDRIFNLSKDELLEVLHPTNFIGRAPEQVREFLEHEVAPLLKRFEKVQTYRLDIEI